jgi:hypothetical protein
MCQSYAAWLRGEIDKCASPWVMNAVIIPHAEDVAAIYRRELGTIRNNVVRVHLMNSLAEFEQMIESARNHFNKPRGANV